MGADLHPAKTKESTPIIGATQRVRQVRLRTPGASVQHLVGGALLVRADEALGPYPKVLTDRLTHWAKVAPDRICAAKRQAGGEWRRLTYAQALAAVRSIGQALLDRELSADRLVVILSENDLEHLLLMLAGQHVGIPTAHLSPVYSLVSRDFTQLASPVEALDSWGHLCLERPAISPRHRSSRQRGRGTRRHLRA